MGEKWHTGVDLGGTTVKIAFVSENGEIAAKWEIPTDKTENGTNIIKNITASINDKLEKLGYSKEKLTGIGMGAPGFLEMETGFVYHAVNIGWRNYPLKDQLEKESGMPVIIDNDANIAALGEMWKGAGEGASDLLCVTLGTGVGGGIIANSDILHGTNGMAGEIGHITAVAEGGYMCNCGRTGCLETIASATGIARIAQGGLESHPQSLLADIYKQIGTLTVKDVVDAAEQDDQWALAVIDKVSFHLGLAIANLAIAFNPAKIVIGGGVSKAGDVIMQPLQHYFKKFAIPRVVEGAEFAVASLGNDAGVIGGAWLVRTKLQNY
jgi:glucokinase